VQFIGQEAKVIEEAKKEKNDGKKEEKKFKESEKSKTNALSRQSKSPCEIKMRDTLELLNQLGQSRHQVVSPTTKTKVIQLGQFLAQ
jgi:hypothetical protein